MAAKGDGFAVLVAAEGIAAIVWLQLQQRQMARHDGDAAQL
jgi:hypothetical protein